MGRVFLSYSRHDIQTVDQFASSINQMGMQVWIDREDIKVGNSWRKEIVEAIDNCDAFVFMMSSHSVASTNVHKEIILAQDSGKPIYVVMLEVVRLPAEIRYQLAGLQFINFPLLGFEKSNEQLITVLKPHQKKTKLDENKQTELVIQGIDISAFTAEKQAELLAFISNLTNADSSQLKIANVTAGSIHVFVDMPASTAFDLKTFALNRDNRFAQLGIVSLRLVGNKNFINASLGIPTTAPTLGLIVWLWLKTQSVVTSFFGVTAGNIVIALTTVALTAGIGLTVMTFSAPPLASDLPITDTVQPSVTSTLIISPTNTNTLTPTITNTPEPEYEIMNAVVKEHLSCVHGPGELFLYRYGMIEGIKLQVFGKDIHSIWVYVQAADYEGTCWVNLNQITLVGDAKNLKVLYPGEIGLPLSFLWPVPQNVYTARTADGLQVAIYWDEYILPDGEIESPDSPRYLLELWLCKDKELTFESKFVWDDDIVVIDEAGCDEPSHGVIYLVEKHGYAGPVEIPWP
jgi:hypothetical protein